MNHIYKVIWSQVKNSYVVVSEIAGTAKKSGRVKISKNALAAALTAFLLTSSVAGAVDNVIVGNTEAPNTVTNTTDSTVVGIENKVKKEKDDVIVGKKNTIEDSEDVRVVGKGNTVTNSDRQNVFGDNNSITNRDAGTVSGYHGITRNSTSDLVIGMGNKIKGNDTYMKGTESLTVIGNNNETVNPTSGIVIGDYQTFGTIKESVIIGSMTPEEKASGKREQGSASVVVGYNAQSGGGLNVAVGHSALALGHEGTVTGHNSVIEGNDSFFPNIWSSIYGVNNKITSNGNTSNGVAGSIIGTWNKLDNADNSMIFGSGNILSHATVDMSSGLEGTFGQGAMTELLFRSGYQEGYSDQAAKVMGDFANTSGSVLIAGNGNSSDYARRSQIIGTGNVLNGTANGTSANNTMAGFQNTGTNVNRVAVVGTGNKISDGTSDVVIGDYHEMSGGTNNVILGAMATKEDVVSKTYTPSLGNSSGTPGGYTGRPIPYNVRATVPTKTHTANISNAVMLGYNTDVQKNGGVALGSESVSSVDAGVYGYSPDTNQNIQNDTEIANLTGKTARLAQLNGDLPGLSSAYTAKKADYEGKVNDFLAKSAEYTQAYQTYHSYEHSGDQYDLARKKKMDDAKTVMDTAQTAMNAAKTDYTDAETKYNSALGERNLIIGTWKATAAAVSVGDVSRGITRQITGVAAGTQDTDAVNVAQLKTAKTHYYSVNDAGYHSAGNYNNDGAKGGMALAAGAGAAANGTASTVTGAFSRVDGNGINGFKSGFQGATSSVYGTFNVVGAKNGVDFDGVANSIVGVANKTENANAALIFGAGNKVTNSYRPVDMASAAPLASALQKAINTGNTDDMISALEGMVKTSGGSVLAIGGANTADYAQLSKLVGVGNKLTGTENKPSAYNMIDGYLNTGKNINHVSVIGSENEVEDTDDALVFGNKRKLTGATGSIILGSGDRTITTNVSDAVSIGHNANVEKAGGVALGSWSVANTDRGVAGYDPAGGDHANDTTGTWKATAAAVSVGKAADPTGAAGSSAITRQITNVAAGTQDTDAVNVAQLKAVQTAADASKVHFFSVKGNSSDENYNNDGATGDRALAVGVAAKAGGLKATALTGGNASGDFSFAVGNNAQAKGWGSVAIGAGTLAEKQGTVAIGHGAKAYSLESVALGYNTQAGAPSGQPGAGNHAQTAMGSGTIATGGAATAFGFESVASGAHAIAGGDKAKATGQDSVALGKDTKASGTWSVALGSDTKAEGQSSTALGTDTTASGIASTAMGSKTQATGVGSTAMGGSTTAAGNWSLASGGLSEAKGDYSTAMGYNSKASARNSFAVSGGIVEDAAKNSIAMGEGAKATVSDAVALGSGSVASTEKGKIGYDISGDDHSNDTTGVWKSTANAVSVGDAGNHVTRQITGVAAGTQDTDAVNVAQLKKAVAGAADGNDTLVSDNNALSLSGKTLSMSVKDTAGNEVKGSVDLSAIAGQIDTNTTYTMSGTQNADNTTTITLKGSDGKENKVTVATKDTRNTVKAGENVTLDTIANTFGGTEYTVNVKADGKVENGSTKIVSGNTVYHETRVKNDGNYVKKENSAGDNLTILDKQVGKNTTNITNLGNTINNLNGKLGNLDNRISKVGAGAAALAALHPLDFDPHDKWDIAAGFGNYRNASAAAVGLFYRPNERTMMSLGWTMGDDRNMINAGVSVKLGRGDVYTRYSKVEMANQIRDLKERNDKMQAENKEMRSELDELKAQVAALAAKK